LDLENIMNNEELKNVFTIKGRVPSKKNSRINTRSGRSFPSSKYTAWHKDASKQLTEAVAGGIKPMSEAGICLGFWFPDDRRSDLTNKAESIMDLLVDNGLLEDDRWQYTGGVYLIPLGIDRENPRVEIAYN